MTENEANKNVGDLVDGALKEATRALRFMDALTQTVDIDIRADSLLCVRLSDYQWERATKTAIQAYLAALSVIRQQSSVKVDDGDMPMDKSTHELFIKWQDTQGGNITQDNYEAWKAGYNTALRSSEMPNGSGKED